MRPLLLVWLLAACGSDMPSGPHMAAANTVGAACTADADCTQTGASCVLASANPQWLDGYCTVKACTDTSCPAGSFCQMGGTMLGATTCLFKCSSTSDCRSGYECVDSTRPTGTKVCAPGVLN